MLGPAFELEEGTGICCPLRTSGYLSMENSVLGLCNHRSHFLMWEVWHVFQARNLAGSREVPTVSGGYLGTGVSDLFYLNKFPGMVHCPTLTVALCWG